MPRMYETSWLELKKSNLSPKRIRISAPAIFHRRIYKAIIKEKDMDKVYKWECSERDIAQKSWLSRESKGGLLTIYLHFSIGTEDF